MKKEKTQAELLSEKLMLKKEHFSKAMSDEEIAKADAFCEGYKTFLSEAKTERECVDYIIAEAEENGFVPFVKGEKYKAGDKVYYNNRGKSVILAKKNKKGVSICCQVNNI